MFMKTNASLCEKTNRIFLSLLNFGHAEVGAEWKGRILNPDFSRLYYILSGEAEFIAADGQKNILRAGAWVLIPAGFSFDYLCRDKMEHFYFHIKLNDFDGLDMLASFSTPVTLTRTEEDLPFFRECLSSEELYDGLLLRQRLESILFVMQKEAGIVFESTQYSRCVVRAIKYIKRNLSAQLTLDEIAKSAFVSKSTLTKHFRRELAMSVSEYVTELLLFEASQRLLRTDLSVLAISEKYGFSDQFYFSRRFKQKFGCSPQQYRRNALA